MEFKVAIKHINVFKFNDTCLSINSFMAITATWWFGIITSYGNDLVIFIMYFLFAKVNVPVQLFTGTPVDQLMFVT